MRAVVLTVALLLLGIPPAQASEPPDRPRLPSPVDPLTAHFFAVVGQREHRAGLKACYERARREDAATPQVGRADVEVRIRASGLVQRVVVEATPGFRAVAGCLRDEIKGWRFARNRRAYARSFPLLFQGG
jgi:hypothetical protein